MEWFNKMADMQPEDIQDSLDLWKAQNNIMGAAYDALLHSDTDAFLQFDFDIRHGISTIIHAMESASYLPKGTIVWRAVPVNSTTLSKNPEKFMSVSATKEGALHFANGRAMRICEIEIGDDGIQGMPIRSKDDLLDAEDEIIIRPGFKVSMITCAESGATVYKITKA